MLIQWHTNNLENKENQCKQEQHIIQVGFLASLLLYMFWNYGQENMSALSTDKSVYQF